MLKVLIKDIKRVKVDFGNKRITFFSDNKTEEYKLDNTFLNLIDLLVSKKIIKLNDIEIKH